MQANEINDRLQRLTSAEADAAGDPDISRRDDLRAAIREQWRLIKPFAIREQQTRGCCD